VFERFFWFNSHQMVQYFMQGSLFCSSIYFAMLMQFGNQAPAACPPHRTPCLPLLLPCARPLLVYSLV